MEQFEIRNLSFSYPGSDRKILDQVSFAIEKGSYVVLCGKSGSGKTTLLRHLKSVLTPHGKREGSVWFNGQKLEESDLRIQSERIGYVMQQVDDQIVTDKVWHELAFGLESLGTDPAIMRMRTAEMASYFGIQSWFYKNVSELSGGQKQLLNLASIMAMRPEILILDEPTSQLDPIAASDFLATIHKINRELGTTILITEHRLEDILHCADQCLILDQGQLIADGTPRRVGQQLRMDRSDLFSAMPVPMRVFYELEETSEKAPLTVREGRTWLEEYVKNRIIPAGNCESTVSEDSKKQASSSDQKPILRLKEVWFRYEKNGPDVLKDLSLDIRPGTLHAIVGGNGTGKSTALKSICGICKPYRGQILLDGVPLRKVKDLFHENLAMLPQDPKSLFVKKTVKEDLEEMFDRKVPADQREEEVRQIARLCEIDDLLSSHPYDLSCGEQQRTALAKVLLTHPRLLLLDEPTKGLDNFFKRKLSHILKQLTQSGMTLVLVSHDVEFCAENADLVSMFFDGQVLSTNPPRCFFSQNSFYTTAANRMARNVFPDAITARQVIEMLQGTALDPEVSDRDKEEANLFPEENSAGLSSPSEESSL